MEKLYIGISGKMGSGKSTLTNGLIEALTQLRSKRVSVAAPIYNLQDIIYKDLGMKVQGDKDRDLLIALGMWGRDKNPDFWLEVLDKKIQEMDVDVVICDDVRFENEADFFKEKGILMRIEGTQRGDNVDHNINNKTETALDTYDFPFYLNNRNTVEDMLMEALYCIAQHLNVSKELMDEMAVQVKQGG